MYANPSNIRNERLNLSITEAEKRLIDASADFNDTQPAPYARELLLWALANQHLRHADDSVGGGQQMRVAA